MPAKKLKGTDITKAQGQETTKNVRAMSIHLEKFLSGVSSGGTIAKNTASPTTSGV